jgi:serine/threonine-protein kinase
VVHRDVKPRNIFLDELDQAKIGDFGIARVEDGTTLTTHPHRMGTPAYMSPEACAGRQLDWRSDQYSLGVTLFELLTGERPFKGQHVGQIIAQHLAADAPRVEALRPDLCAGIGDVVARMMAKKPERRFSSYQELAAALEPAA